MTCLFVKSDVRCLNPHTAHTCCWWVVDISNFAFSVNPPTTSGRFTAFCSPIMPHRSMTIHDSSPAEEKHSQNWMMIWWMETSWNMADSTMVSTLVFSPELETRPGRATGQGFRTLPYQLQLRCGATCCVYDLGAGCPMAKMSNYWWVRWAYQVGF